jgi:hypothetical protein
LGYAVGNIDADEFLDLWIVTHKDRNAQNLLDDLQDAENPNLKEILGL